MIIRRSCQLKTKLLDQDNFYLAFQSDIRAAKHEVIIESPFLTLRRLKLLLPDMLRVKTRGVRLVINTKPVNEQDVAMRAQAADCIALLQCNGIVVLQTGGHHRKLAIIDRRFCYEGSLNILSFHLSCQLMRRTDNAKWSEDLLNFLNIKHLIG